VDSLVGMKPVLSSRSARTRPGPAPQDYEALVRDRSSRQDSAVRKSLIWGAVALLVLVSARLVAWGPYNPVTGVLAAVSAALFAASLVPLRGRFSEFSKHALALISLLGAAAVALVDGGLASEAVTWLLFVPMLGALGLGARGLLIYALGAAAVAMALTVGAVAAAESWAGPAGGLHALFRGIGLVGAIGLAGLVGHSHRAAWQGALWRLHHAALSNPLTGLPNRAAFDAALVREDARAARNRTFVGLMMIDLDGFKAINDLHGHAAGDLILQKVARRLRRNLRAAEEPFHLSGDEFAVVIPAERPDLDLRRVAARLGQVINGPYFISGASIQVRASVGWAVGRSGEDPHRVLERADQVMVENKSSRLPA